jgi:hypothetical protein
VGGKTIVAADILVQLTFQNAFCRGTGYSRVLKDYWVICDRNHIEFLVFDSRIDVATDQIFTTDVADDFLHRAVVRVRLFEIRAVKYEPLKGITSTFEFRFFRRSRLIILPVASSSVVSASAASLASACLLYLDIAHGRSQ